MCIAIPSPGHRDAGKRRRWWRYLAASPLRLLGLSAVLQLAGIGLTGSLFPEAALLPPLFAAVATALLGLALSKIPQRLGASPLSYPLRVLVFVLVTTGGLLALLPSWTVPGQVLALIGWLTALRTLWWQLKWAPKRLSRTLWVVFGILSTVGVMQAVQVMLSV